jgi:hypothetical protein
VTTYSRQALVEVLVLHYRKTDSISSGCGCGWSELGRSHPQHVAEVYEALDICKYCGLPIILERLPADSGVRWMHKGRMPFCNETVATPADG